MGFSSLNAKNISNHKLVIGYSGSPSNVDFWNKLKDSLFSRAKELDVIVIDFSGNDFTFEAQKDGLINAVELQVDGMIIGAVSHKIADTINIFKTNNIPVIAINVPIENNWVTTTIATNNTKAAQIAGKFLLNHLKKRDATTKRVVILCGDRVQEDALIRASVPHNILVDAGYNVHDYFAQGWSSKFSLKDAMAEYSNHGKDIAAVFSCYAGASIASVEAAKFFGYQPLQVGFDMDDNMYKMIKAGRLDATVMQNPKEIGRVGIQSMLRVLRESISLPKLIEVPAQLITHDNIENFEF